MAKNASIVSVKFSDETQTTFKTPDRNSRIGTIFDISILSAVVFRLSGRRAVVHFYNPVVACILLSTTAVFLPPGRSI